MAKDEVVDWGADERAFDWLHAGFSRRPVEEWVAAARDSVPPAFRSGHLGNWGDIESGCAGVVDYNRTICKELEAGKPLIHSLGSTESARLDQGDWIYFPGSRVKSGRRWRLDLYTRRNGSLEPAPSDASIFLPSAFTDHQGSLISLIYFQYRSMREQTQFEFETMVGVLSRHRPAAEQMLVALLNRGQDRLKRKRWMRSLLRGAVDETGVIDHHATLDWEESWVLRWRGEPVHYTDSLDLAAAFLDVVGVAHQQESDPLAHSTNAVAPLMSSSLILLLTIVCLDIDYREGATGGVSEHLHWGALQMAGLPPERKGYFAKSGNIAMIRRWCEALQETCDVFRPLRVVLLPVAPFLLCPSSSCGRDRDLVDRLLAAIDGSNGKPRSESPQERQIKIHREVRDWLGQWTDELSPYFLDRFSGNWSIMSPHASEATAPTAMPAHLGALEMTDACSAVCALHDELEHRDIP